MDKSKRKFLKASLFIAPVIGAGYYFNEISYEKMIKRALYKRLNYLKLDEAGVNLFATDYTRKFQKSKKTLISIDLAVTAQETFPWFDKLNERINSYEDYIVVEYLESSDFFIHKQNEARIIKYIGINNTSPYTAVCSNPFADFSYD